jgi:HEAT repeat protein
MTVNRRMISTIVGIAVVLGAVWGITRYQRSAKTGQWIAELGGSDQTKAMQRMNQLEEQGVGVAPRLRSAVASGSADVQWRAAKILGEIGSRADLPALTPLLESKDKTTRAAAALAVGKLGGTESSAKLAAMVSDQAEEATVRISAARALGLLRAPDGLAALKALAREMGKIPPPAPGTKPPAVAPPDDKWELRAAAASALGLTGMADAAGTLQEAATETSEPVVQVRTAATYALGAIGAELTKADALKVTIGALLASANDKEPDVRAAAIYSLGRIAAPSDDVRSQISKAIDEAVNDPGYWVREAAKAAKDGFRA